MSIRAASCCVAVLKMMASVVPAPVVLWITSVEAAPVPPEMIGTHLRAGDRQDVVREIPGQRGVASEHGAGVVNLHLADVAAGDARARGGQGRAADRQAEPTW